MNKNLTILSTRELEPALVEKIHQHQLVFDQMPFIEMIPRSDEQLAVTINKLVTEKILAIFTSRTAVDAVQAMLQSTPANWEIACMGGATRKEAADLFGESSILITSSSAKELGEQILKTPTGQPVVFFAGNRRLNDLPVLLQNDKVNLTELIVYDTIEIPELITQHYDAILFFSPSAAQSFFSINTIKPTTVLFSIGETTASVIRGLAPNTVVVSPVHSPEKLFETVISYFKAS